MTDAEHEAWLREERARKSGAAKNAAPAGKPTEYDEDDWRKKNQTVSPDEEEDDDDEEEQHPDDEDAAEDA